MNNFSEKVNFIRGVADLLRGDYRQSECDRVILPFIELRRLDQVLAPTRDAVHKAVEKHPADSPFKVLRHRMLLKAAKQRVKKLQEYRQALITAAVTGQVDITKETAA